MLCSLVAQIRNDDDDETQSVHLLWPPYGIGQAIIFLPWFLSFFFFFLA